MPESKWKLLLVGLMASAAAHAQVDKLVGGTTTQTDLGSRYAVVSGVAANVSVETDPIGTKPVLKMRVMSGDPTVAGASGSYVAPTNESVKSGLRWYAMSVYFPAGWTNSANPVSVLQIATSQASGLAPPLSIQVRNGNLEVSQTSNHLMSGSATPANSANETFRLAKLVTGKWYCFVVKAEWYQTLGSGNMTLWMNGDKIYDAYRAINNYGTAFGNTPRVGLMYPGVADVADRTIYTDFVRLGGATTYVEQIYAETPCAATATTSFSAAKAAATATSAPVK
ncbi:heparin lyase I family protein [Duganella violaceipulchra]|uniref:Polysaccharide lyase n=1 Tax=Duganella violaceipulchra TaxID=2849652 RepID=A0AA41H4W0_9BURK|nr:heparin lyase I family protein [Duganella violaceicalia]MBV6319950.1 polysaccharide lyase [Duganella violaceicalia]MCP2010314.1 hypothetical protein [Duganella violaceicalia]